MPINISCEQTHSKFVIWKLLLQQLNQCALPNTGGSTDDYGTASTCRHGVVAEAREVGSGADKVVPITVDFLEV